MKIWFFIITMMLLTSCSMSSEPNGINEASTTSDSMENISSSEEKMFTVKYESGDSDICFQNIPAEAKAGDTIELKTDVLMDSDIHVYVDGVEIKKTHSDSDYWGYSFVMPNKDVVITTKYYSKDEIFRGRITGDIARIKVSSLPEGYYYEFSDKDDTQQIADYFNSLNLIEDFEENPDEYSGMTWVININYSDNREQTVYHFGNMFVRIGESNWCKMNYGEAVEFEKLLDELNEQHM